MYTETAGRSAGQASVAGIVLAGEHAWDRASLEYFAPRALWPVGHQPVVRHVLRWMAGAGIRRVTICANSRSRLVRQALNNTHDQPVELDYYEDWAPRGPAGCVYDAGLHVAAGTLVVTCASIVPLADLADILIEHTRSDAGLTVVARTAPGDGASEGCLVPAGIYVMARRVLEHIPRTGYQDIKEMLVPALRRCGESVRVRATDRGADHVMDIATYLAANARWLARHAGRCCPDGYRRRDGCLLHESCRVSDSARLIGPVLIGRDTSVAGGATLVGPAAVGHACRIETEATICRSVLWSRVRIGAGAMLDRCVVTDGVEVAAHRSWYDDVLVPSVQHRAPRPATARRHAGAPHKRSRAQA